MNKLTKLTAKEESGEANLNGLYKVTINVYVSPDKQWNVNVIEKLAETMGDVEDMQIEKYTPRTSALFNVGDTIVLSEDFRCEKTVYIDSKGNLIISDRPVESCVEKVGSFLINLPEGTVAEVNKKAENDSIEILFTGDAIEVSDLRREAYLGVLEIPCKSIVKYDA